MRENYKWGLIKKQCYTIMKTFNTKWIILMYKLMHVTNQKEPVTLFFDSRHSDFNPMATN